MSGPDPTHRRDEPTDVAVITQFFPPEGQGGGYRWEKLIDNMDDDNLRFRVICPPPTYPYGEHDRSYRPWQRDHINDIPVTRLWTYQPGSDVGSLGRILNYGVFSVLATLYVLLNFWRYDCVVTMSTPHTTFLPGAVAKLLGRAWIVDIFDLWLDNAADLGYVEEDSIGFWIVAKLEATAMHHADQIIVLTPTMAQFYQEKYGLSGERFTAVPFGVDRDLFSPPAHQDAIDRIIYVGNLGAFYAFEPYLRAFAHLDDRYELYFVGWGEERERLKDLCDDLGISDRVTFTGRVPRKEVPELLASATLNLVPLETDYQLDYARPTKMLEGMAVGLPYIASPLQEIQHVTEESEGGLVVENDPSAISDAMEQLLSNPNLRRDMEKRGVQFIEQEHRWDVLSDRMQSVITGAV